MSSLSSRVFLSSSLLLLVRFLQRGIGLISTLVLARLLTPEDFGIVAIIAVVIQFFEIISAVGTKQYLIQKSEIDHEDLNTAWTINLCMKSGLWLILVLATPLIAQFLDNPEISKGLWVASLALLASMLANPGIVEYERALNYSRIVKLSIIQKIASFSAVMIIVVFHQSYWALIIGNIVAATVFTVGSYRIHSFRPGFSLSRFKQQFNFSQWVFYRSIFGFVRTQIDTILVSKNFSLNELGVFHLVKSLIHMPATDVISPAIEPLLSAFSRVKENPIDLAYKVRVAFCFIIFLVFPMCIYVALFPKYIVNVLLGSQWERAYQLMPYAAPLLLILSVNKIYETICVALGKVRELFYYNVFSTIVLTASLVLMIGQALENFVLVRSGVHLAIIMLFPYYLTRLLDFKFSRVLKLCFPIVVIATIAGVVVGVIDNHIHAPDIAKLLMTALLYGLTYGLLVIGMYLLWLRRVPEYLSIYRTIAEPVGKKIRKHFKSKQ